MDFVAPVMWTPPLVDVEVGVGATPIAPRSMLVLILDCSTLIAEAVVGVWTGVEESGEEAAGVANPPVPPTVGVVGLDVVWKLRELWEGESKVGSEFMLRVVPVCNDEEDLEMPIWENGAKVRG